MNRMDCQVKKVPIRWWGRCLRVALIGMAILMGIAIVVPQFTPMRKRGPDSEVKANLKNASTSQEAYFMDHDTYTSNVGSLPGFNQSANVYITMEATTNTYVITGTVTEGCKANTGTWSITSTTGAIHGTPCSRPREVQ